MISKENSHFLKLGNSFKNGIDLKAMQNETGNTYYSVKITEELDLQEDPKVSCKNYAKSNGYGKVCISINPTLHRLKNVAGDGGGHYGHPLENDKGPLLWSD